MLGTATFLYFNQVNPESTKSFTWIPLVMFILIFLMRGIAVMPVKFILLAELFPTEIRTLSVGICQFFEFGSGALIVKLYPDMKSVMQRYGLCYFFAIIGFIGTIWAYFTIPDNRSKSLIEIEKSYDTKTPLLLDKNQQNKCIIK